MYKIMQKILILLILVFSAEHTFSQKLPENLDKIIKNPELVQAIDDLAKNSNRETKLRLMRELNEANYLVPVLSEDVDKSEADEKGVINLKKDSDIRVLSMKDGKGNEYMPVFTDIKSAEEWSSEKQFNTIAMPAHRVWNFVLAKEQYDGVVVNPGVKALPLKKETIKFLRSQNSNSQTRGTQL